MPQRKPAYRRVTPLATRRETQRRAALAALALIVVVGGLGLGVYVFGGNGTPESAISSVTAGQRAIDAATADLAKVTGPGIDLVADDPGQALQLLSDAYRQLDAAAAAHVGESVVGPLRQRTLAGLDRLYGVVPVRSTTLFTFAPADGAPPIDLRAMVRGPDGVPYVIDCMNPAPDMDIFSLGEARHRWCVSRMADLCIRLAQKPRAQNAAMRWSRFFDSGATPAPAAAAEPQMPAAAPKPKKLRAPRKKLRAK